jgi:lactate permease
MSYLIWSLPLIVIVLCMASGRVSSIAAGLCGLLAAAIVALSAAPTPVSSAGLVTTIAKGLWLSALVAAVILAGLLFREVASAEPGEATDGRAISPLERRRRVFFACFLVGPFAEAATGFGVGQVTTIAMLQAIGLPPLHVVLLGLFSQVLVSWGAMANGTIVGAAFAGLPPHALGLHSALLSVPLLFAWLLLFWRMAASAGLINSIGNAVSELVTLTLALALLILANAWLGPEIAGMAALGPLIVIHFWWNERPDAARWRSAFKTGLPYAVLILGLAASRGIPAFQDGLRAAGTLQPFAGLPSWIPLLHPGTWLLAVGIATAALTGRLGAMPRTLLTTWRRGRGPVATIAIYLIVAQVMADGGMATALAMALGSGLGAYAVFATPWLAGAFGFLTGSSNASNGLLMNSQVGLSIPTGLPVVWIAALQNSAAAALTMLSPARIAMGCALVKRSELEASVYRKAWPLGAVPLVVLTLLIAVWTLLR